MTLSEATNLVAARGFTIRPQIPHYGEESSHCAYLYRNDGEVISYGEKDFQVWEYILLVSYEGCFLEAIYEKYLAPKETRRPKGRDVQKVGDPYTDHQKRGFLPIYITILRSEEELSAV